MVVCVSGCSHATQASSNYLYMSSGSGPIPFEIDNNAIINFAPKRCVAPGLLLYLNIVLK